VSGIRLRLCRWALALALSAALLARASAPAGAEQFQTKWVGSWYCDDRGAVTPLRGARVELWQRGIDLLPKWLTDDLIAVTYTDDSGAYEFNTVSNGEDDFYVRVLTDDNDTTRLGNWWEPWPWFTDTGTNQNDVPVQSFGDVAVKLRHFHDSGSPECAIWQGIHDAYLDFEDAMGFAPPGGERHVQYNVPALTPFSPYTAMMWPPFYAAGPVETVAGARAVTNRTTFHEFAHTFRHAYDGGAGHFFYDAARFDYPQTHNLCKDTNSGFAFNEGWAEYWSGDFPRYTDGSLAGSCPGTAITKHTVEGNVALSLLGLDGCFNYTRQTFVDTLIKSPEGIHSFDEFKARLEALHGSCSGAAVPLDAARIDHALVAGWRRYKRSIADELGSLSRAETKFEHLRRLALEDLRDVRPCWRRGSCLPLLVNRVRPAVLGGELASVRVLEDRLSFELRRRTVRRLGKPMTARFQHRLLRRRRGIEGAVADAEARWLARALKAVRPILRHDDSARVADLGHRLRTAIASFRRGRLPAGYTWPSVAETRAHRVPRQPDLVIERLYFEDPCCTIYADVRNIGDAKAPASETEFRQVGQGPVDVSTPALDPGAVATVSTECVYGQKAQAIARADAGGDVAERDELNNVSEFARGGVNGLCVFP